MTFAGTAVAVFAAALLVTGLTGGSGTDTAHLDEPRVVVHPAPQPVLRIGDSVTWGSP